MRSTCLSFNFLNESRFCFWHFEVRVQYRRRKKGSRSLSHLLMSFLSVLGWPNRRRLPRVNETRPGSVKSASAFENFLGKAFSCHLTESNK